MIKKLIARLKGATTNEKMMYSLMILFIIGIIIRWDFISKEVGEAFGNIFTVADSTTTEKTLKVKGFVMPEPPITISLPEDKQAWMVENMWGAMDKNDTTLIGSNDLKDAFAVWAMFLNNINEQKATEKLSKLYTSLESTKPMHAEFIRLGEGYFGDPNSQLRNDKLFLGLLDYMIASDALTEVEKIRPTELKIMTLKNQVGEVASNLSWVDASGAKGSLNKIKTPYKLLMFYTPGCNTCAALLDEINGSNVFETMVNDGQLSLIALYSDDNEDEWNAYRANFPNTWINGMLDADFHNSKPYAIRATPSLYLIGEGGIVIVRDGVSVDQLIYILKTKTI